MRSTIRSICGGIAVLFALEAAPARGQYDDAAADAAALPADEHGASAAEDQRDERAREGTRLVSQLGKFKTTGDRLTFHVAGTDRQYLGLENLALERVGKMMLDRHDQADQLQWEVTGVFTEYRGTNYLLVTHAVLKTKSVRSALVLPSAAP